MRVSALLKRRISAGVLASLKARRPPETMADIPASTRIAAKEYADCVYRMQFGGRKPPEWWEKMDPERRVKHRRFLSELAKIGITWRGADEPLQIAQDITKRRWRAKGGSALTRWIEKAGRLGWRLSHSGIEARREVELHPTSEPGIYAPRLTLRDDGSWELGRRADNTVRKRGRGNIPSVREATRLSDQWGP